MNDIIQAVPCPEILLFSAPSMLVGFALGYLTGRRNHHGGSGDH